MFAETKTKKNMKTTTNQTEVKNNGVFTIRTRTFMYKGFTCKCTIQYSNFYKKTYYTAWYKENDSVGFGNLTKKSLNNYINCWINLKSK